MSRKIDKNDGFALWLVLLTTGAYVLFRVFPEAAEMVYGGMIYGPLRSVFDVTIGQLAIPVIYLVLLILLTVLIRVVIFTRGREAWMNILFGAVWLVGLFFWMWGFNYMRPNVKERLSLEIPEPNIEVLDAMFCDLMDHMPDWRRSAVLDEDYTYLENEVRRVTKDFFKRNDLPSPGNPRIRRLYPKGVLLGTSTAGIFIPHAFEAHFDAGLHSLVWPHVMAHELSHAYGVTDEGECNFIASVACHESGIPAFQYSGALHDLRYIFGALVRAGRSESELRIQIDEVILQDLREIRALHDSYPQYVPESARNWLYDRYLKAQGVRSGLRSYGEVLGLLVAWRLREG